MSINVTVSGNPVSINRGKMVTCDPNYAKKEYEKRRLMRLEQVRKQSKDIAEDVRNKVRREKKKQMNQIEEEGKQKLKNWQNRKLLELQTQYKEALRELGTGHKEAVELDGEEEVLEEYNDHNKDMANHRSQVAATHLQMEKEKKEIRKSVPMQQKKFVRDVEKARASLVSNMKKKQAEITGSNNKQKKRKTTSADINITLPESDSESGDIGENEDIESLEEEVNGLCCECSEDSQEPRDPLDADKNFDLRYSYQESLQDFSRVKSKDKGTDALRPSPQPPEPKKNFSEYYRETPTTQLAKSPPIDTRISDRIKRRGLMASQLDYCDTVAETNPTPYVESNTKIRDAIDARYFRKLEGVCTCEKGQTVCSSTCGKRYSQDDIPTKPPVKLKESDSQLTKDSQKTQFYDHPNRFSQEKLDNSRVEKIPTESLEVEPNATSEAEWQEKMKQRDKDARIRGQKALEKERIQKDYEEMMKKLPLLQKKERISQITKDKPRYHMGEERLREKERERQNKLDNAYSKLFPSFKPAIVTLPRCKKNEEVKYADEEPVQSINVGNWDVDHEQKMFTAEEVQEIVRAFTEKQKPKDRQAKLKELLRGLKLQKEQLLEEIKALPKDDSINQLINDLNSFSDSDETAKSGKKDKSERKRRREEVSADSSTESTSSQPKSKGKSKKRETTKVPSPRKKQKMKTRRKVLVLQNTSTQTTPKIDPTSEEKQRVETKPVCKKLHVPCDCNKENESTEDLCHILIKLNDKDAPEVVVKAKDKGITSDKKARRSSPKKVKAKSVAVGTDEVDIRTLDTTNLSSKVTQTDITEERSKSRSRRSKSGSRTDKSATKPSVSSELPIEAKSKSWKEHLSKYSFSTGSTSYYSPPDFGKSDDPNQYSSTSNVSKQSLYNLRKKPQQGNVHELSALSTSRPSSAERTIEPTLLKYIKNLLVRSRESIENLTVSTSSVQTPSSSVVEMDSNNPMAELHNIIKYFNLKTEGLVKELSYSTDHSPHYNTTASSSGISQQGSKSDRTSGKEKETSLNSGGSKDSISLQYADITDTCSKRIAALAVMINQIREEKIQILNGGLGADKPNLSKTGSDKEHSTAYLDLPESKDSSKQSSLNSLDDEELHKKLMDIDLSLARKLRRFTPTREEVIAEDRNAEATESGRDATDHPANIDTEIWGRLKRLMHQDMDHPSTSTSIGGPQDYQQFIPFLSDIPKLPKLEIQDDRANNSNGRRPPPSKGLTVAKKFNGNISLIPHELSTIIEADSQLSTKLGSNQVSPNASKTSQSSSPRKELQFKLPRKENEEVQTSYHSLSLKSDADPDVAGKSSITSKKSPGKQVEDKSKGSSRTMSPINLSYDISSKSIFLDGSGSKSTISAKKSLLVSSSSSEDIESIEAVLKSIGMEWAIPTLHKTQEALALTSSSSSLDISAKKTPKSKDSSSEVSLKEYLRKQVMSKVSSSTMKSDASPASLLSEFSEMSSIQVSSKEKEKENKRTSTPVTVSSSKSRSERRVVLSGDSDISSVREESQRQTAKVSFRSLSDQSVSKND